MSKFTTAGTAAFQGTQTLWRAVDVRYWLVAASGWDFGADLLGFRFISREVRTSFQIAMTVKRMMTVQRQMRMVVAHLAENRDHR